MDPVLLAAAASALFLTGLAWFVQVVHYPLLAAVGDDQFLEYHRLHSKLTTRVVLGPMVVHLVASLWLVADPPDGETALALPAAGLAVLTWVLTGLGAVPQHRAMGSGFDLAAHRRLLHADLMRTLAWTAASAITLALIAVSA